MNFSWKNKSIKYHHFKIHFTGIAMYWMPITPNSETWNRAEQQMLWNDASSQYGHLVSWTVPLWTHGCQTGDCIWSFLSSSGGFVWALYIWVKIHTLSPHRTSEMYYIFEGFSASEFPLSATLCKRKYTWRPCNLLACLLNELRSDSPTIRLTRKVLNFWKFTQKWSGWISDSYCSLKPLWSGMGGSSAGSYLADPTSPIPSHCASIVATSTVRVKTLMVWHGGSSAGSYIAEPASLRMIYFVHLSAYRATSAHVQYGCTT